ncbi:hypothetical protein SDC9_211942 [bioreactor metagenome]|uniref:Uncharacterized protein n=1 Tax=bioreactor metagenome TaxID=1076179 RepID=A0A645JKR3_9ZZZZ
MAFNLTRYLNRLGAASYFFTRDGFGSLRLLKDRPAAAFNHITAGIYAGLGTMGVNNFADKEPPMVGNALALNGNAPGGYDQAGRYFFTSVSVKF